MMTNNGHLDFKNTFHLIFQGIIFCIVRAEYQIEVPAEMSTFTNSCVVIPCKFHYSQASHIKDITGLWYQTRTDKIFVKSGLTNQRSFFIGNLMEGNCSIVINAVQKGDARLYKYRVEMNHFKYSYKKNIFLNVRDHPETPVFNFPTQDLPEHKTITVICSTTYTCSFNAPELVWSSHIGQVINVYSANKNGTWKVESKQIITTSRHHDGFSLTCQAKYPSGAGSPIMTGRLVIAYSPEILQESWCRRNVSLVYCECMAIANPLVNIRWNIHNVNITDNSNGFSLNSSINGSKTVATLKGIMTSRTKILCNAHNKEGSVSYSLTLYEKPEIFTESHCRYSFNWIECQCVVSAMPPAILQWGFGDLHVKQTTGKFTIRSSTDSNKTVASLEGQVLYPTSIWCSATNEEGSVVYQLPLHVDWQNFILIGGGIIIFLALCGFGMVFTKRKCRSQKEKPLEKNSYILEETMPKDVIKDANDIQIRNKREKPFELRQNKLECPKRNKEDTYANIVKEKKFRSKCNEHPAETFPDEDCIYANV